MINFDFIPTVIVILMASSIAFFVVSVGLYYLKQRKENEQEVKTAEDWGQTVGAYRVAPIHEEVKHELEVFRARAGEDMQVDLAPFIDLLAMWEGRRNALPYDGQQAYYTAHEECRMDLARAIHDVMEKRND